MVTGNWEILLFGTANTATKKVVTAAITPSNFYKDWILVDNATPLPVTLLNFDALCENNATVLNWSTASENNNDYFAVEKSTDGFNFSEIATVQGSGNSTVLNNYSYTDNTPNISTSYYRLKQVDFDGRVEYFNIVSSNCSSESDFTVNEILFNVNSLDFNVHTDEKEALAISLYDYSGRLIVSQKEIVTKGSNSISLNNIDITMGVYMLNIVGENNHYVTKIFKQ